MSKILNSAKEILQSEAKAILSLSDNLTPNFEHAVQLLLGLSANGHVITSGMGKAGFIARKISATFASIGVPSFYLHPAEAVHGDIGRFTKFDLALILSNSGETPEVLAMLPQIKRIGCPVISISGEEGSALEQHSDVSLFIGKCEEVGPLKLAPTTSTTVMLALGDALAMTLLEEKGLTRDEYAFFHPGGALGKSLLKVEDIMRRGEELCIVPPAMLCKEVLHQISLAKGRPGAALIADMSGVLIGIFTDGDLRRCLENGAAFLDEPVEKYMGNNPKSVQAIRLASEAERILTEFKIDQVAVVDESKKPIGLIDIQDIVR